MRSSLLPLAVSLCGPLVAAQDLCQGNGVGEAYLSIGPAVLGGAFVHDLGSPNVPNGVCFFAVSDGFQTTPTALLGPVCLSVGSPAFALFALPTDSSGNAHLELALPGDPALLGFPSFFSSAITFEGGAWSVSKTAALIWQLPDAWDGTGDLVTRRFHHTATALYADGRDDDARIFVAGGSSFGTPWYPEATAATELYRPLDRTFVAGPSMAAPRTWHTATRLADGRVLITGGVDGTWSCHKSCEIFDPAAGTLTPVADMSVARAQHTATLLGDGRVLVTGGFQDYSEVVTVLEVAMSTAQRTAEIFDPATGAWTPIPSMQVERAAHTATVLPGGDVLLVGGISGGLGGVFIEAHPVFASSAERFDPTTETFAAEGSLSGGRSHHAACLLGDGRVLVTGGYEPAGTSGWGPVAKCEVFDGAVWSQVADLPQAVAWHSQATLADGAALVVGGSTLTTYAFSSPGATADVGRHDGSVYTPLAAIGENPGLPGVAADPRGAMSLTPAYDGTFVLLGGTSVGGPTIPPANGYRGFVYTPLP